MIRVALVGAGGHASDVLSLIESRNRTRREYEVVAMFHSNVVAVDLDRFLGRGVEVRSLSALHESNESDHFIAAVGYPEARRQVVECDDLTGMPALTVVHASAELGTGVKLGSGVVVLAQTSVSPLATIGDHAYVSHGALVGHDTEVGAFASLMPGSSVSGDCSIGDGVVIGSNATVLEKVKVGAWATVGAGSVVTKDVAPGDTVVGVPARSINGDQS